MPQIKKNTLLLQLVGSFLITLFFLLACDDTPNGPEEPPPGSRDYTWKVYTFFIPFTSFLEITGTSENDVWVCGPGDSQLQFFHFDGEEWTAVPLNAPSNHIQFQVQVINKFGQGEVMDMYIVMMVKSGEKNYNIRLISRIKYTLMLSKFLMKQKLLHRANIG
jgi:hypothetical protein